MEVEGEGAYLHKMLTKPADVAIVTKLRRLATLLVMCVIGALVSVILLKLLFDAYVGAYRRHATPYGLSQFSWLEGACAVAATLFVTGFCIGLHFWRKELRRRP